MSKLKQLKRKRSLNSSDDNIALFVKPKKRQKLEHTDDKPLRYMFIYTHTLIENYEAIIKDSWIRAVKFAIKPQNCVLLDKIVGFFNKMLVSVFIEDDVIETLFDFIKRHQQRHEFSFKCDTKLKYELMKLKDEFFEDNMHKINLKKGIRVLLREIKEELIWTMCLIHRDSRNTLNLLLNDVGLRGYFNAFVCASSIASHLRPYIGVYDQCVTRSRIFKQQSIVLVNYPIEATQAIFYGLYPILITNKNIKINGEYFMFKEKNWMNNLKYLLIELRKEKGKKNVYCIDKMIDNYGCIKAGDKCKFLNNRINDGKNEGDGLIYNGIIKQQTGYYPYPIMFEINYIDSNNKHKTVNHFNFLIWKE